MSIFKVSSEWKYSSKEIVVNQAVFERNAKDLLWLMCFDAFPWTRDDSCILNRFVVDKFGAKGLMTSVDNESLVDLVTMAVRPYKRST